MDEKERKKRERISKKLDPNNLAMIKSLRNMEIISQLSGAAGIFKDIEARQNKFYNKGLASSIENISRIAEPNKAILDSMNNMFNVGIITDMVANHSIFKLNPAMEAWQSNIERMSEAFNNNYNEILAGSINSLTSRIGSIADNTSITYPTTLEMSSFVERVNIAIEDIEIVEFTEELEEQVDLQEIRSIMESRINHILNADTQDENFISYAMDKLLGEVIAFSFISRITVNENLIINLFYQAIIYFVLLGLKYNIRQIAKSYTGNKKKLEAIKKEFRIMNFDETVYNSIRVVLTDDLGVLSSRTIDSEVKYKLDMGDLLMVEEVVGTWTKINYIDMYTGELGTGWVFTRYIKRLD